MAGSKLIELTYFDPKAEVRLTAYADTIILDRDGKDQIISAIRFGGYPEMVRAMSDAIYGGATVEAVQNEGGLSLKSRPKGYQRQLAHDGPYAAATLMASDDMQSAEPPGDSDASKEGSAQEKARDKLDQQKQPRKCYIFCPAGDRDRLLRSWTAKPPRR